MPDHIWFFSIHSNGHLAKSRRRQNGIATTDMDCLILECDYAGAYFRYSFR